MQKAQIARDADAWNALRRAAPADTVFASPRWLHLTAELFRRDPVFITAPSGAQPLAGAPLLLARRGPITIASMPPISAPSGMLVATGDAAAAASAVRDVIEAIETRTSFAQLHLPVGIAADIFDTRRGWMITGSETLVVDIGDWDAAWRGFSQSLRRKVRRADEQGLTLTRSDDALRMSQLFGSSYARHGILPPVAPALVH
jgi:hypothetical protein